eukprot:1647341-Rhodomonas_salina.3
MHERRGSDTESRGSDTKTRGSDTEVEKVHRKRGILAGSRPIQGIGLRREGGEREEGRGGEKKRRSRQRFDVEQEKRTHARTMRWTRQRA